MKKKFTKQEIATNIKNFLLVIAGTLLVSLGTSLFLMEFDLVAGGISGISIVLDHVISSYIPALRFITINMLVTGVTWTLFFVGLIVLGKSFALKTLVSTIIYPLGIAVFSKLASPDVFGGFFYLKGYASHNEIALILATVLGGACVGSGCAITFLGGGSTGGVDVIAFTVCKIFKRAKSSVVLFVIDTAVIVCGMFVIHDFVLALLGIISAFVSAMMVDKVFIGNNRSFIAQIISDKHEEINREILERIERGSTVIDVKGGFTGDSKKMIMVSFTMNQYSEILNAINHHDKHAFVTIHQAHEINGEGWTR